MTDTKRTGHKDTGHHVGSGEDKPTPETGGATRLIEKIAGMLDPEPEVAKDERRPPIPPA